MISFRCASCGQTLSVGDEWAGKDCKCPRCQRPTRTPAPSKALSSQPNWMQGATLAQTSKAPAPPQPRPAAAAGSFTMNANQTLAGSRRTAAPPPDVNVPGYEIFEELGRGGMGVVYKARHAKLKRLVALKMILAGGHASEKELIRFRDEAEAVARLQHPNIIQIYETGEHKGLPYFSLEFCGGGCLTSKINGTPLPANEAAQLTAVLARAMHAAHQQGIIHRDLKPANVLLTTEGAPKITDFGLAKKLDDASGQTQAGAVVGTPSYMAPEQALGDLKAIGPATDVYALGAILYELLTGRPPFRSDTPMNTVFQVVTDEPVPPSQLQSRVPEDLETICLKCLEKKPGQRYASALDLANELQRFLNNEPILAKPISPTRRALKWARRRPAAAALLFVTVTAGLSLLIGGLYYSQQLTLERNAARAERDRAVFAEGLASKERDNATLQLTRAERAAYVNRIALAQRELEENNVARAAEILEECPPSLRNWEYHHLAAHCGTQGLRICKGHSGIVYTVAVSPNSQLVASGSDDKTVRLWDASTGKEKHVLTGHGGAVNAVVFSPDSRLVASASDDKTVRVWSVGDGRNVATFKEHANAVRGVSFSPDGQHVASASDDRTVRIWEASTGREVQRFTGHTSAVVCVAYHRNGQLVASGGHDGMVALWQPADGRVVRNWKAHDKRVTGLAFDPDGGRLASCSVDETVKVWNAGNGQLLLAPPFPKEGFVFGVGFSADGRQLARVASFGPVRMCDTQSGRETARLTGRGANFLAVAFSADGKHAAAGSDDHAVALWSIGGPQPVTTVPGVKLFAAFSPDSRLLASSRDGSIALIDLASNREVGTLRGHQPLSGTILFSADGRRVAASGMDDHTVNIWDAKSGQVIRPIQESGDAIVGFALSPDGKKLATANRGRTAKVWDIDSGRELFALRGHTDVVSAVSFRPDGQRLATASWDGDIKVWSMADGKELLTVSKQTSGRGATLSSVVYSPDGQRLAAAGMGRVVVVSDANTGQNLLTMRGHVDAILSLDYSKDGQRLLSSSVDRSIKVWETSSGQELLTLKGHANAVLRTVISPDGRRVASADAATESPSVVKVWDAPGMTERPSEAPKPPPPAPPTTEPEGPNWLLYGAAGFGALLLGGLLVRVLKKKAPKRGRVPVAGRR